MNSTVGNAQPTEFANPKLLVWTRHQVETSSALTVSALGQHSMQAKICNLSLSKPATFGCISRWHLLQFGPSFYGVIDRRLPIWRAIVE